MKHGFANEVEVLAVPEVPFTKTWAPVHHGVLINQLENIITSNGQQIVGREYQLTQNGMDMFGTWTLDGAVNDGRANKMVGFRNSLQKTFSVGLAGGHRVFVCSNMAFSGDWVEHRKHTSGIADPAVLMAFLVGAVGGIALQNELMAKFFDFLAGIRLTPNHVKTLTYDVMEKGIVPPSKFQALIEARQEELRAPTNQAGTDTLQVFHGAVTRVLRGQGVGTIQDRTGRLNRLLGWGDDEVMAEINK